MCFPSESKIIQFKKQKQYVGMGITWYFVDNACCLSLNDVQFLRWVFAAEEKMEEQYSR